jgi:nitroimidazol reductase NimA-like FMN-containing flavoprotein (pyridoxamine 5'-phosphate oxidase superfamily)
VRDACLEELTDAECRHLVAERHLGRLALIDAQSPVTGRRIVIPADLSVTW